MELPITQKIFAVLRPERAVSAAADGQAECVVPDTMPDVLQIEACFCSLSGLSKTVTERSVTLAGMAEASVLYRAEDGRLCPLSLCVPLHGEAAVGGTEETVEASLCIREAVCTAQNSRKVSLHVSAELTARAFLPEETALPVELIAPEAGTELARREVRGVFLSGMKLRPFTYGDEPELPAALPPIETVLSLESSVSEADCRMLTGKAALKATLSLRLRYLSGGSVCCAEFHLPFTQVVECAEAQEDREGVVRIRVLSQEVQLSPGSEGRRVHLSLRGEAALFCFSTEALSLLADAYSTRGDLAVRTETRALCTGTVRAEESVPLRETLPVTLSEIREASAAVVCLSCGTNEVTAELCVTLCGIGPEGQTAVTRRLAAVWRREDAQELLLCDASVSDLRALPSADGAEISCTVRFSAFSLPTERISLLFGADFSPDEAPDPDTPALTVRRVLRGERFFEVGRAFRTPLAELFAANELTPSERAESDLLLLIPR